MANLTDTVFQSLTPKILSVLFNYPREKVQPLQRIAFLRALWRGVRAATLRTLLQMPF